MTNRAGWSRCASEVTEYNPSGCRLDVWRNGELVAYVDPDGSLDALEKTNWSGFLTALPDTAAVADVPTRDNRLPTRPFTQWLGPVESMAAVVDRPVPRSPLIVRQAALDRVCVPRDVDEPVWDWLIRATAAGEEIHVLHPDDGSASVDLPRLAPSRPPSTRDWLRDHMCEIRLGIPESSGESGVTATALRAGLLLWHDLLDESHKLSQSIEGGGPDQFCD
jgi:hypothetical protein